MRDSLDLDLYPLDRPGSDALGDLVARCRADLARDGLFNLPGFVRPDALARAMAILHPRMETESFTHAREHTVYFGDNPGGLAPDHPALRRFRTANRTLCGDQLSGTFLEALHGWPPLAAFLAETMGHGRLYPMADPLAKVNVMAYRAGEALNWHFDRSEFTTTLLLQAPEAGGAFEYARDLRSDADPNHAGVAALLRGDRATVVMPLAAGTLNVFRGKNTAHRVTPVEGGTARVVSVLSYFDRPGVTFSDDERLGFYGRVA